MSDSADIKMAAQKLSQALQSLERVLEPKLGELTDLRKVASESESFETDRARLAQELDDARAKENEMLELKEEFRRLAGETTQELDRAISQVQNVLERD